MSKKSWRDLSPRARRLVLTGATIEGMLKLVVLIDLKRRPASDINGSKTKWAAAMFLNTAGVVPMIYLLRGRRLPHRTASDA